MTPTSMLRASAAALFLLAGQGLAQTNLVQFGPSFEQDDPNSNFGVLGWWSFNASASASTEAAHTGLRSCKLVYGTSNYAGVTTNYFDSNNLTYPWDPVISFLGGPITVSGWYMIPTDHPIVNGAWSCIKLQPRRTINNSAYQEFEWPLAITGHTNGQWVYFERTVQNEEFGAWPFPPPTGGPTRCSVLPQLFGPNGVDPNAVIYWDDIRLTQDTQGTACYPNCDHSTIQPCLNVQDFSCFLNSFANGETYANCDASTIAPILNVQDFGCFLNRFATGCSGC